MTEQSNLPREKALTVTEAAFDLQRIALMQQSDADADAMIRARISLYLADTAPQGLTPDAALIELAGVLTWHAASALHREAGGDIPAALETVETARTLITTSIHEEDA